MRILCLLLIACSLQAETNLSIVGGGIIGALESYYAIQDAKKSGETITVDIYERGEPFGPTNTAYNIAPSLTPDEILSVVPRGNELIDKLQLLFSQPGGIRVDDVVGLNDSPAATQFKQAVVAYSSDKNHDDRTLALLNLGKQSMDQWQKIYDDGDATLKGIMEAANFNPCREPRLGENKLHDGYRIDLIYGINNAENKALGMKADYDKLGYTHCTLLSPDDVIVLDPFLKAFVYDHSEVNAQNQRVWKNDSTALWRPGGCLDARTFLPKFYDYLGVNVHYNKEVTGVTFDDQSNITGLQFSDGTSTTSPSNQYVFCPGESVGTLNRLGFNEPAYASFAGPSLLFSIPLTQDQTEQYKAFSHCMEVHGEGIVLAWQARYHDNQIRIGVAGTKAFYGDKQPQVNEDFACNRNIVHLNMVNQVLPDFVTLACGYPTKGKTLTMDDLTHLQDKGLARRWVGRRAVAYDGFPTLGSLYHNNQLVANGRCTTHLGSGGVSFGPAAVQMSRSSQHPSNDAFVNKILTYADSRRVAN